MADCTLEKQGYRRDEVDEKLAKKANSADLPSTTTPKVAGTAAVGTEQKFARGDHVHPAQTSVTGNAGTATKLATGRTIGVNLAGNTSSPSFDGSGNITIIPTGTNPISRGGTGATTAANARINLEVYSKSEVDTAISNASMGDYCPSWWKPGIAADATWFTNLHNYLNYTSSRALSIPLGLRKKVKLTSAVNGITEHYIMVIG